MKCTSECVYSLLCSRARFLTGHSIKPWNTKIVGKCNFVWPEAWTRRAWPTQIGWFAHFQRNKWIYFVNSANERRACSNSFIQFNRLDGEWRWTCVCVRRRWFEMNKLQNRLTDARSDTPDDDDVSFRSETAFLFNFYSPHEFPSPSSWPSVYAICVRNYKWLWVCVLWFWRGIRVVGIVLFVSVSSSSSSPPILFLLNGASTSSNVSFINFIESIANPCCGYAAHIK